MQNKISVETVVKAPVERVWEAFNNPEEVKKWNNASPDWHCPKAENDLQEGGKFNYRMESKDGKQGFDFGGIYTEVTPNKSLAYEMSDGRKVETTFEEMNGSTKVTTAFDPESENTPEFQKAGWQGILENFKQYVEAS